ncbi:ABC transporter substrate-binding protein [Anaerosporobacter sp.]|uniref:ABC transporter substrate-binding protein n=1 Tax=Anaerosporobacter sp. TaxID=1872529 RepID=UPI00286F5799|nr:extracellular solute-binding protein [Anaerosporobacter sp.]
MRKNKKLLSAVLVATMAANLMVGCQKNDNQGGKNTTPTTVNDTTNTADTTKDVAKDETTTEPTAQPVTVTLGIWPEDTLTDNIKVFEGYVETMKKEKPNVTYKPAYFKYESNTFMPRVQAGNCPTIFETWFTEPQKLIKAEAVADITDQLVARGWLDKMNPAIRELLSDENGRVYGIPRDGYALGLMLNVELFEEAGLVDADGYPIYPKTWTELAETAKTIKEKTGSAGLCLLAKDNAGGWHFSNIAWAFGATLCTPNEDGTYTANLNSPEAIKAMEYVKSLKWDYDVLTANPTNEDWGTGFTQLGTGNAAMYIGANDAIAQPTQVNGLPVDKVAICPIPAADGGQFSLYGGTPYMFSKDATPEEIDAALDFLEIMGKAPEVNDNVIAGLKADAQTRVDNGVPVIQPFPCWTDQAYIDAQLSVVKEYQNVDAKMFGSYFDATSTDGLRVEEPGLTQDMYEALTNVMQAVLTDKNADVATLLEKANSNYQVLLDEQYKK